MSCHCPFVLRYRLSLECPVKCPDYRVQNLSMIIGMSCCPVCPATFWAFQK